MSRRRKKAQGPKQRQTQPIFSLPGGANVTTVVNTDGEVKLVDPEGRPYVNELVSYTRWPTSEESSERLPERFNGAKGPYRVTFALGIPGTLMARENFDFDAALAEGNSLLILGKPDSRVQLSLGGGETMWGAVGEINSYGRLARIVVELDADDLTHARGNAHNTTMPMLSWLSLAADVPLAIAAALVEDLTTGTARAEMVMQGFARGLREGAVVPASGAVLRLAATYREALNSQDPLHQALSYFRILEGVYVLRSERQRDAMVAGKQLSQPVEQMPTDEELQTLQPRARLPYRLAVPYAGQKFTRVKDAIWNDIRNALAHFLPSVDPLGSDDFEHIVLVQQFVPVLRYMAKELLVAEQGQAPSEVTG